METAYKTTTIGLDTYLNTKNDSLLKIVKKKTKEKSNQKLAKEKFLEESSTSLIHRSLKMKLQLGAHARMVKEKAKHNAQDQIKQEWEEK